ncbi:Putative Ca2+/H+ antiporter, TMEM165/GDT1 family [Carboxydocella sporoproducens DSM 16521]|uniref:GDT1 family protein n=2 Tax=Carboxydocella TaxID=178898 RepID=A0A1T4M7P7_9FIRM|nr:MULTISPECIES: TMEM165/GDT1 family protein [Carboxydocella]AVX21008.1 Putative Ca2+/H+ antiporter, TMEM165/GDT1 family [Carboxydocella thermautotrophica]SJZ62931.1 Putative Ca2+/H+ antiporter, TMEM165/GDT1 family [Carboxydocella sporoproducens DSM 16521]
MTAFIAATIFVVLAEMGDKTQLLGMAFATKYKASIVLAGVLVATLLNHLLAVAAGEYLTRFIPMHYIQLAAAISFVIFGLWTIRGDTLEGEAEKEYFSPFWTVTFAFFIAEMGDKTQLATVALAAKYQNLLGVWLGTTTGMMISNIIGILVGVVLGKQLPERLIKLVSAGIFILFGYLGIWQTIAVPGMRLAALALTTILVVGYVWYLYRPVRV